jgi:hypothetical protein
MREKNGSDHDFHPSVCQENRGPSLVIAPAGSWRQDPADDGRFVLLEFERGSFYSRFAVK